MSQPAEPQLTELAEWARPWLSGILPTRMVEQIPAGSPQPRSQNSSLHPPNDSPSLISSPSFVSLTKLPDEYLVVTLGKERTVSRALRGVHLFVCEDLRNSELERDLAASSTTIRNIGHIWYLEIWKANRNR